MNIFAILFFFLRYILLVCIGIMNGLSDRIRLYDHHIHMRLYVCELSISWQPVDL